MTVLGWCSVLQCGLHNPVSFQFLPQRDLSVFCCGSLCFEFAIQLLAEADEGSRNSDLPTCPYLMVLVRKSASSMDIRPYFSKYGHGVSRKYGNGIVNECKFVACEADRRALIGGYHSLIFAYFNPFAGLKYTAGPDWSKKFVKPINIDFASKLYRS